ncbi:hypothetical protein AB0G02_21880 [Actinosynnema sp. NPDC023658]|uniref:hypothetical protein n=1 Tax=Actinosynnema sp. NPDC023658 TaxID=3155465 RepID=UPI0033E8FB1B
MSNLQVPTWIAIVVPIGAALIGATGPTFAQLINAWKERTREETRWKREQLTDLLKIGHEHVAQWRAEKVRMYGGFLGGLRDLEDILKQLTTKQGHLYDICYRQYLNQFSVLVGTVAEIQLIGSTRMLDFIADRAQQIDKIRPTLPSLEQGSSAALENSERSELITLRLNFIKEYRQDFLSVAREELGVRPPSFNDLN